MRLTDKVRQEIINRYRLIRAIHTCYYTCMTTSIGELSTEFFYLVGDVLEGKPIDESKLRYVDMDRVRDFLKEDH